jgi:hypothetical protein
MAVNYTVTSAKVTYYCNGNSPVGIGGSFLRGYNNRYMKFQSVPRFIMGGVKPPLLHAVFGGSNNFRTYSVGVRASALDKSKTSKGEKVYQHNKGVLYFLNTIRFHSTPVNVISFTSGRKVRPSARFSRTSLSFRQSYVITSSIAFHPNPIINVKRTDIVNVCP